MFKLRTKPTQFTKGKTEDTLCDLTQRYLINITQEYHLNRAIYIGNNLGIESIGFSANQGKYRNYNYVRFREYFSICKSVIDVIRNREPHFLGTEININGVSNYSKEDKR